MRKVIYLYIWFIYFGHYEYEPSFELASNTNLEKQVIRDEIKQKL